jgi:nucleosome binding factor SPN SPT16 subunit
MEQEFEQVKRRRVHASKSAYTTPTMSGDEDSSDEALSAQSADDVDSMYSENLSESESEHTSSSEYDSTDIEDTEPRVAAAPNAQEQGTVLP